MTARQDPRGTEPQAASHLTAETSGPPTARRASLEAVALSGAVSLGWAVLASTHPTTTYHFAPLIAASGMAIYVRARVEHPLALRRALSLASGGALIAVFTAAVLENLNVLRGPTLWGPGNALPETILAIAAGLLIGLIASVGTRRPKTHT